MRHRVIVGDCLEVMAGLNAESVDAIVTDPPYALTGSNCVYKFQKTGSGNFSEGREAKRKGFMGKEWDGQLPGIPFWSAALRVAKPGAHLVAFGGTRTFHRLTCAIEDAGWEIRDCLCWLYGSGFPKSLNGPWGGTALKPAWEPIVMARKPLIGTVAANVERYGTGGVNVGACRIGTESVASGNGSLGKHGVYGRMQRDVNTAGKSSGRWPANVCLDEAAGAMLDEQAGGGPSRFFYCAKASRREREAGLDGEPVRRTDGRQKDIENPRLRTSPRTNHHPTVKPIALMRWLCRLVTPPDGLILDPFTGSGTTGCAAALEGFRFTGIEREADYAEIAEARIAHWSQQEALPL